jgi:hypothetical protein
MKVKPEAFEDFTLEVCAKTLKPKLEAPNPGLLIHVHA